MAATRAKGVLRGRVEVTPRLTLLLGRAHHVVEPKTRSATIIGAMTGGGIGLLRARTRLTRKDREKVKSFFTMRIW